jgi:hypothetical protein
MEDAIATKATSALNARLGDADGKLKELGIKWGIEYGILRDAFDDLKAERDRYRKRIEELVIEMDGLRRDLNSREIDCRKYQNALERIIAGPYAGQFGSAVDVAAEALMPSCLEEMKPHWTPHK